METKKMSLANMQGKLSRAEMKNVMAGDESLGDGGGGAVCKACQPRGSTGGNYGCVTSTGKAEDCKCLWAGFDCDITI